MDLATANWNGDNISILFNRTNPTEVEEEKEDKKVVSFSLSQNYPNPFNSTTLIPFTVHSSQLTENSSVRTTLTVYNILGQRVRVLVDGYRLPGEYRVVWDGKDDKGKPLSSGVYFYRLRSGEFFQTKKLVLLR